MHEIQNPTASPKRVPWNRGKLIGPRPPLRQKDVWQSERRCRSSSRSAIWRYSIWPLIASYAATTLSRSEWMTLPLMGTPSCERACAEGRPADRCALS